ncbi:MAG TPA: hypothetical protein VI455_01985 [Terriglobia bacterium]
MGKGRFLNQKLGKRTSRRLNLLKSGVKAHQRLTSAGARFPKKGSSRELSGSGSAQEK